MATIVFLSAVSDEFHKPDPDGRRRFESYRSVLSKALRALGPEYVVIAQEDLVEGFGDLLNTLDDEIRRSQVVVHLIGNMAGYPAKAAEVRRLRERHPTFLHHEPELGQALADVSGISYTQWEMYLAYEHGLKRLVFLAEPDAVRSPACTIDRMDESQSVHVTRVRTTGEHRGSFEDQKDLALKVVTRLVRFGLGPTTEPVEDSAAMASARVEAGALTYEIAEAIRKPGEKASADLDPTGVEAYLRAVDTAALERELTRRQALEVVAEYLDELREAVDSDPDETDLSELALAELALGNYPEAIAAARQAAQLAEEKTTTDPDQAELYREEALNAYLLLREAAVAARRREEAIAALERGCALIDRDREPILWAEYHLELAEILLDQAKIPRAEELIDEIIDIREEHEPESVALASSLLVWCRLFQVKAQYQEIIGVAQRAERIFQAEGYLRLNSLANAISLQGKACYYLGRVAEAESLYVRALAIEEAIYGIDHPAVAPNLANLGALFLQTKRITEAEQLMRRALAIGEEVYGNDHPDIARILNNLGAILFESNRLAEAEPLIRRGLEIDEATHGTDHPEISINLNNLARLLEETNREMEAETLLRRALAIDEAAYGAENPRVAEDLVHLARLLRATNRKEESERLYLRALAINETAYGTEHTKIAVTIRGLSRLLHSTNRMAEAERLIRRALAIDEAAYEADHLEVAADLNILAMVLRDTDRVAEAEPLIRRAVEILALFGRSSGHHHSLWSEAVSNYRTLLSKLTLPEKEIQRRLKEIGVVDEI